MDTIHTLQFLIHIQLRLGEKRQGNLHDINGTKQLLRYDRRSKCWFEVVSYSYPITLRRRLHELAAIIGVLQPFARTRLPDVHLQLVLHSQEL